MQFGMRFFSGFGALALALLLAGGDAWAKGPRRGGKSGSSRTEVTRTGPGGQSRTWSQDRSWKRGDARFESTRTRTGPRGGTRTKEVQAERTADGYKRGTTWTDARGRQATRDANVAVDREAGTRTRDVEYVGRDGKTRSRQDVTTKTDDGYTRSSVFTKADGSEATRDAVVSRDAEAGTRSKDVTWTGPDGETRTRSTENTRTDDGYTTTTTVTR